MEQSFEYYGKKCTRSEIEKKNNAILNNFRNHPDERIKTVLHMIEGKEVLDVGCAYGTITRIMAERGFRAHGIDRVESILTIAQEFNDIPNVSYDVKDFLNQPFPDNSFDCITFLETIEHVEHPAQYLREFNRILKPNGCLVLSTPNSTSLKNFLYALSYRKRSKREQMIKSISAEPQMTGSQLEHIYNWDFPTLARLIDKCGFDLVDQKFVRAGPIIVPLFGKRVRIIGGNSKILNNFAPLKTTHVMKCRKKDT